MKRIPSFVLGMLTGGGLLAAGLALGGQAPAVPPVEDLIRAKRIEIVDEVGTVRLALGSNTDGGTMSVRDKLGHTVVLASAAHHGGVLVVNKTDSKQPAFMAGADASGGTMQVFSETGVRVVGVSAADGGRLTVADSNGRPMVRLETDHAAGKVTGLDVGGRTIYRLQIGAHGDGLVEAIHPESGSPLVQLGGTADHHGLLRTLATNGRPLVLLTASERREGQIYMMDDQGHPLIALATRKDGPTLRVYDREGNAVVSLEGDGTAEGTLGLWRPDGTGRVLKP